MFRAATILGGALTLLCTLPTLAQTSQPIAPEPSPATAQFRDVTPQDWAAEAITQLDQRYNCLAGYPNGLFEGDRPLSRQEFAAGLHACLATIEQLIAQATDALVTTDDLAMMEQLTRSFQVELAVLRARTDAVTARVQELEASQFSTTTQLRGQVVFAISDELGGKAIKNITLDTVEIGNEPVVQHRTWIELTTSFTGRDRLRTRLAAGNPVPILVSSGDTGGTNPANFLHSNDGRLAIDSSLLTENTNGVYLDLLSYDLPLGDRTRLNIYASGGSHFHYANTLNPFLDDQESGAGAISRFGQRNPIYGIGGNGIGVGLTQTLSEVLRLDFGYLANEASVANSGLLNGNYSLLGQLTVAPNSDLQLGLTYVHAYNGTNEFRFGGSGSATGSFAANLIPLALNAQLGQSLGATNTNTAVVSSSYGFEALIQPSNAWALSGWVGLTQGRLIGFGDATIWNWAIALSLPDLGQAGNLGMLLVGNEPTLKSLRTEGSRAALTATDPVWHVEAAYQHRLTDRISLTPGLIWLPALNQDASNSDVWILTLQSRFQF
ncbi:MAG: iron uptake porin [Spirulina sp. SIO3F2]|nr:iron uptake porin [Spirulina sp. SIO3F2]